MLSKKDLDHYQKVIKDDRDKHRTDLIEKNSPEDLVKAYENMYNDSGETLADTTPTHTRAGCRPTARCSTSATSWTRTAA